MTEDEYTISVGHLDVGDGHKIYYQQWGNPKGVPTFYLHGGPVFECKDKHKLAFDPSKHHVIFHDQRGGGLSTSDSIFEHNTADDRVEDIEKLRKHFGFETIQIFGFSWGSTLALYYALKHTDRVIKMLIGGVYAATSKETDNIFQGGLSEAYPEAWGFYIEQIPKDKRNNTLRYYADILENGTNEEKIDHLIRFNQLESSAMSIDGDYPKFLQAVKSDTQDLEKLDSTKLSIQWFMNNCYIDDGFIPENANTLSGIPTVIVQGRYDLVCRANIAYSLAAKMGQNTHLHMLPGAHREEGAIREVQRAYAWSFLD